MTSDELFARTALSSWKLVIGRFSTAIEPLTGEQLQKQVAPGKTACSIWSVTSPPFTIACSPCSA
jgi:hypothetical protein